MSFRSLLYVPAHAERFLAKAHQRQADAIVLDLEDAVPLPDKAAARDGLLASVASVRRGGAKVFVRINEGDAADALAACRAGADGLFVPKVQRAATLRELAERLEPLEVEMGRPALKFVAVLEDPGAVLDARAIAGAPRVMALAMGSEDFALALGGVPTPDVLRVPKLLVHYAAKAAGLFSFGLLRSIADFTDLAAIAEAVQEARQHGFDGATCIHPAIVPLLNAGFAPSADEIAWAKRVIATAEHHTGTFALDGNMVDAPVLKRAQRIVEVAGMTPDNIG